VIGAVDGGVMEPTDEIPTVSSPKKGKRSKVSVSILNI
jgi:hypothetical protein